MHSRDNWDHLRYVLAVAEAGSVSKAARTLGVNHATVLRHVAAFEGVSGAEIFDKSATGYAVHDDRLRVIDAAREVETAVLAVQQIIKGFRAPVRGLVRVTSTDTFCQLILPGMVAKLQDKLTELQFELISTSAHLDFARMRADITVRPARQLGDDLLGVRAAKLGFDVYCAKGLKTDRWLGYGGVLERLPVAHWLSQNVSPDQIAGSSDSFMVLAQLATSGLGQVIIPCVVGDHFDQLERCPGIIAHTVTDIWVASHVDLANVPRIKVVRELLVSALMENAGFLEGLQ